MHVKNIWLFCPIILQVLIENQSHWRTVPHMNRKSAENLGQIFSKKLLKIFDLCRCFSKFIRHNAVIFAISIGDNYHNASFRTLKIVKGNSGYSAKCTVHNTQKYFQIFGENHLTNLTNGV